MYVDPNFKTKAALKRAVTAGERVLVFSPGPFPPPIDGTCHVEGPHYPAPHSWYATVDVRGLRVTRVH